MCAPGQMRACPDDHDGPVDAQREPRRRTAGKTHGPNMARLPCHASCVAMSSLQSTQTTRHRWNLPPPGQLKGLRLHLGRPRAEVPVDGSRPTQSLQGSCCRKILCPSHLRRPACSRNRETSGFFERQRGRLRLFRTSGIRFHAEMQKIDFLAKTEPQNAMFRLFARSVT